MSRYGDKLRELRAERRLSLREVEERGGPSKDTMSLAERGVHKPNPQTLGRIATALDMTVGELHRELEAAEAPKAASRPEFFELPGLDAALKRHGMSRSELAFRARMTPGEVLDYEIGAKKPSSEVVERLADTLGAARYELTFPPEQVEARLIAEKRENELFYEEQTEISASEILKERSNPASRRVRDGYEKSESERRAERDRKDKLA